MYPLSDQEGHEPLVAQAKLPLAVQNLKRKGEMSAGSLVMQPGHGYVIHSLRPFSLRS
jgi:hypothetical protein